MFILLLQAWMNDKTFLPLKTLHVDKKNQLSKLLDTFSSKHFKRNSSLWTDSYLTLFALPDPSKRFMQHATFTHSHKHFLLCFKWLPANTDTHSYSDGYLS